MTLVFFFFVKCNVSLNKSESRQSSGDVLWKMWVHNNPSKDVSSILKTFLLKVTFKSINKHLFWMNIHPFSPISLLFSFKSSLASSLVISLFFYQIFGIQVSTNHQVIHHFFVIWSVTIAKKWPLYPGRQLSINHKHLNGKNSS